MIQSNLNFVCRIVVTKQYLSVSWINWAGIPLVYYKCRFFVLMQISCIAEVYYSNTLQLPWLCGRIIATDGGEQWWRGSADPEIGRWGSLHFLGNQGDTPGCSSRSWRNLAGGRVRVGLNPQASCSQPTRFSRVFSDKLIVLTYPFHIQVPCIFYIDINKLMEVR